MKICSQIPTSPNQIIVHLTVEVLHVKFLHNLWDYLWDTCKSPFMALLYVK
jgi:hypothetical protein